MNTNQEERFNENPSTTVTTNPNVSIGNQLSESDIDDSGDAVMPAFAGGPTDTHEEEEEDEEAGSSSNKTDDTVSEDSFTGIDVSESNKSNSSEIDDASSEITSTSSNATNVNIQQSASERTDASSDLSVTGITVQDISPYLYINTHITGLLNDDNDKLHIELRSPNDRILFYEKDHEPEDATQKKLIAYIFLFAKTVKKIADSVGRIDTLLDDTTQVNEVEKELGILHGLLEVIYKLPLQYKNTYLNADPHTYFAEKPRGVIQDDKINIVFGTSDEGQKNWDDFKEKYINKDVYRVYNEGTVTFAQGQQAEKRLKEFEKKYIEPSKQSMMSSMGSFFRGKNKTGGNKKQTRRQLQKPNRRTRRK